AVTCLFLSVRYHLFTYRLLFFFFFFFQAEDGIRDRTVTGVQTCALPISDTPQDALARLFNLPGSHYTEPQFSWKHALAPSPIGFVKGNGLGAQYANDLFVGAARTTLLGGYLFRFKLSVDRKSLATTDSRLADKVADNLDKFDATES